MQIGRYFYEKDSIVWVFIKSRSISLQCILEEDMGTKAGHINPSSRAVISACGMAGFHQIQREGQKLMLMEEAEAAKRWLRPATYSIETI